jgi:hypothetical protein
MHAAQPLKLLEGNRHGFFDENVDSARHTLARHPGLQEEEGGYHGDLGFFTVQHPAVIM